MHELSLLGGPLHRLGSRLGLVRGGTNTVRIGLALGALLWVVLVVLAFSEGLGSQVFSLAAIAGHVRLLLVVPLFFLCESVLDPSVKEFVRTIVRSGIVPGSALPVLDSSMARIAKWKDSWLPDTACLLLAIAMSVVAPALSLLGTTAAYDPDRAAAGFLMTGWWYWAVCLTLFRFLMFRWLWRLCLWFYLLWRTSRLSLELVPTHSDRAAGLGYLEVVHTQFAGLVLAISALEAATFAEAIASGTMAFETIFLPIVLILVVDAVLFVAPLFVLAPQLWSCREKGLSEYSLLASRYAIGFDKKWLSGTPPEEPLLGTTDVQSLADLTSAFKVVQEMRLAPVSVRMLLILTAAALLPMLPLLLLKYPLAELAQRILMNLSGL